MILTKEQLQKFEEVCRPVMKFLCEEIDNPHVTVILTPTDAEFLQGSARIACDEFVRD